MGQKAEATRSTKRSPYTLEDVKSHLAGRAGLGVTPIRDDGTCGFGAIDVDIYPLDLKRLVSAVQNRGLPLVVCRTKSGGAHLYLFCHEGVTAKLVRERLSEWARSLGYPKSEIFPKQDTLENDEHCGCWINLPYFGGDKTNRYAVTSDGSAADLEDFIERAEQLRVTQEQLEVAEIVPVETSDDLEEAPPCLVTLAADGFPEGSRNNSLFNLAIYCKKRYGDDFARYVHDLNNDLMHPPLSSAEVTTICKSVAKRSYGYKCKDQPICTVCDRKTCLTRDYGVGAGGGVEDAGINFGSLTKVLTKPVVWLWSVNGEEVELTTAQLINQKQFQHQIVEFLSILPSEIKAAKWRDLIKAKMSEATEIEPPSDATSDGQLWEYLDKFCTGRIKGKSLDEILLGKPFTEGGRSYFRSGDFIQYLVQHRFPGRADERFLYVTLRLRGLEHHHTTVKGKPTSYWSVPAFEEQKKDHEVPRDGGGPM